MRCLILLRARDVATKFSQSRLGLWPACVMISTMSPFFRRVRSGTILPLTRAPTHLCPTSVRIADFLLVFEQLAHPLEVALVALVADAPLLVLPMRGDPFLRHPVHLDRAN